MQSRIPRTVGSMLRLGARRTLVALLTVGMVGAVAVAPAQASSSRSAGTVGSASAPRSVAAASVEQTVATTSANVSQQEGSGVMLNIDVDVLGIAQAIIGAVNSSANRPGWVKGVMETAFYQAGQRYNVMVFNLNQEYQHGFNDVVFFGTAEYSGITFGIWAFRSGTFDNKGDGGWINWAFQGWFNRNGGHVDFYNPNF